MWWFALYGGEAGQPLALVWRPWEPRCLSWSIVLGARWGGGGGSEMQKAKPLEKYGPDLDRKLRYVA